MSMLNEARRGSLVDDRDRSFKGRMKEVIPWKGDDIKEIIRKCVFIVAICVLAYSAYDAYIYNFGSKTMIDDQKYFSDLYDKGLASENKSSDSDNTNNDNMPAVSTDDNNTNSDSQSAADSQPLEVLGRFEEIHELYPDIVGHVIINGIYKTDSDELAINYPVVQSADNDYYLTHDVYGTEAEYGALFVDYRADITPENRSSNVTIYGHNMKAEAYFHHLRDYNRFNPDFVSEHRLVNFASLYSDDQYIIIGAFLVSVNEEDDNQPLFKYHNAVNFNSLSDFDYWYKNVMYRNYYSTDIECDINDEYLTLSTCSFEITDARFVVVARKLREGEDPSVYTYKSNSKRHMPEKYYKANNLTVPKDDGPDYEYYIP